MKGGVCKKCGTADCPCPPGKDMAKCASCGSTGSAGSMCCGAPMEAAAGEVCPKCGQSPCACGKGEMGEMKK